MRFDERRLAKIPMLLLIGTLMVVCLLMAFAQRPRRVSQQGRNQTVSKGGAKRINVRARDNLQKVLDEAQPGDVIVLEAGASFTGPFTLPVKSGDAEIIIQSSALSQLPADGQRVSPANAAAMPKLLAPNSGEPALRTALGAHHYRLVGVEFAPVNTSVFIYDLVTFGDGSAAQNTLAKVAHHLTLDRCYLHVYPTQASKRGIALNSAESTIVNCYVAEFKAQGIDAQAIGGWNGPGPYHIINNYLEASGNNVLFGGSVPAIANLVASDIEFRRNHVAKQLRWRQGDASYAGVAWQVKNLFELKSARRVVVDGNVFENNWVSAQTGFAILFTVNSDSGAWAAIDDVAFTNNIVRHTTQGLNMKARDTTAGVMMHRIQVVNNLFDDVSGKRWGGDTSRLFQVLKGPDGVTISNNTGVQEGQVMMLANDVATEQATNFVFTNNIAPHNEYGVMGDSVGIGTAALDAYCVQGYRFARNVLVGGDARRYPSDNFFPAIDLRIKSDARARLNLLLEISKQYKGRGQGGKDIGCNLETLRAAIGQEVKL